MAEFDLEKIKIGDNVYKIAAGGNGPTVRTMHWEYGTLFYNKAALVADESWNDAKVGDIVVINAMQKTAQVAGDWLYTNYLAGFDDNLRIRIDGVPDAMLTFNDDTLQAWKTSSVVPNTSNNLISTRHDRVCVITGIYKDTTDWPNAYRFTLRPLSKYDSAPFGIGNELYVATEQQKQQEIADSVVNACGLLLGAPFNAPENNLPGVTCKNASNQSIQPTGGKGKYYLGNGYYLEAMYFNSTTTVQAITHFDFADSTNSSISANILGFYGCRDSSSRKTMHFYDTYFIKGDTQVKNGYWPTDPAALSSSTCLCIYVIYRH